MTHVKDKTLGSPDASRRRRSATSSDEVAESCLGRFMLRRVSRRARRVVVRNVFNTLLSLPFVKLVAYTVRAMPCATCFPLLFTSPLLHFSSQNSRWKALGFVQHCPHLTSASRSAWRSVALWLWWVQPLRLFPETPSCSQSKMQNLNSTSTSRCDMDSVCIHIMYYYVCQCM